MPLASPAHGSVCQELAATCGQREAPLGSTLSGAWLGGARVGRSCLRGLTRQYCHSRDRCRFPSRLWSQPAPKGNSRTFIPNRVLGPDMIRRFRGRPNASSKVGLVEYVSNSHYGFARICERSESTRATSRNANAGRVSLPRSNAERTDGESTSSRSCKTIAASVRWAGEDFGTTDCSPALGIGLVRDRNSYKTTRPELQRSQRLRCTAPGEDLVLDERADLAQADRHIVGAKEHIRQQEELIQGLIANGSRR